MFEYTIREGHVLSQTNICATLPTFCRLGREKNSLQTFGTKGGGLKAICALPGEPAAYPLNDRDRQLGECTQPEMPLGWCNAVKKNG